MSKPWNKKRKPKPLRDKCFVDGCKRRGGEKFTCRTCEGLGRKKPYELAACVLHREEALAKVKKHTLVKHPVNIVRATIAGLKGEL